MNIYVQFITNLLSQTHGSTLWIPEITIEQHDYQ